MPPIRFTSEFSTYSTDSTTLTITAPDGTEIFTCDYDRPGIQPIIKLNGIIEEDMRVRGIISGRYTVDGTQYDIIYREGHDDLKAEEFALTHFLVWLDRLTVPTSESADIVIPVYTDKADEICHCRYLYMSAGSVRSKEIDIPISQGLDEITIYTSQLEGRPAIVSLKAGPRKMSVIFPADDNSALPVISTAGMQIIQIAYRDIMGHQRHIIAPAIVTLGIDCEQSTAKIYGRERLISSEDSSTISIKMPGLPIDIAIEAGTLKSRSEITVTRIDQLCGRITRKAIVTEISGDISDQRSKLNEITVTYREV